MTSTNHVAWDKENGPGRTRQRSENPGPHHLETTKEAHMSIPKIILLIVCALEAVSAILLIGKTRKTLTPASALAMVLFACTVAFLVVIA